MTDVWDVVVVGGGPAGSTAARRLAADGLSVLVLEASTMPRVKPCGGAVSERTRAWLPKGQEPQWQSHPDSWWIKGARAEIVARRPRPFCHPVFRTEFDQWLLEAAQAAGAVVHTGEAVLGVTSNGPRGFSLLSPLDTYRARYLVGADGAKGITARSLGFSTPRQGAAVEVELPVTDMRYTEAIEVDVSRYPWGYAWVIPKGHVVNVGIASFHPRALRLLPLLTQYLEAHGLPSTKILAHPLPFRTQEVPLSRGRAALAGDAAGLMDPFSAEGIYAAIASAGHLADSILEAESAQTQGETRPLAGYDHRLSTAFWPEHRRSVAMARLFYSMPQYWCRIFHSHPHLLTRYLDILEGVGSYAELLADTRRVLLKRQDPAS